MSRFLCVLCVCESLCVVCTCTTVDVSESLFVLCVLCSSV